jgi:hypothetical protein
VLLVFGAPCQLRSLAGQEHGRTIPLTDMRDHSYAVSDDVMIVFLQPVYLMIDYGAHSLRRLGSFERHFQWDLHNGLSISKSQQL